MLTFENCNSYILKAVCRHHGANITSGHYTSDCFKSDLIKWVKFDDNECTFTNMSDIKNDHNAYLLFYERS